MAIKIIKDGVKEFRITCPKCGCEFTYENEDICNSEVVCPCCGRHLLHNLQVVYPIPNMPYNPHNTDDLVYRPRTLPDWATKSDNWGGCEGCPNNPKYLKTPYIGDTPCQWCQKNPNKVTCTSNASKGEIK